MNETYSILTLASIVLLAVAVPAFAQATTKPVGAVAPAADAGKDAAVASPSALKDDQDEQEKFREMLRNMTPEELENLRKTANQARLKTERDQVIAEINSGMLYDPKKVKEALAILNDSPSETQLDNVDRIIRAFAKVDARFGAAYGLYADKKYVEAAAALKVILDPEQNSNFSAAEHYLYAVSLARAGTDEANREACTAYQESAGGDGRPHQLLGHRLHGIGRALRENGPADLRGRDVRLLP